MADNPVVGIDIAARLDQFRAEMAKIPEIGGKEAKALTAQLTKEIKAAEAASKKAAEAAKRASEATKGTKGSIDALGDAAGKTGSNVGKLAGSLDLLMDGGGQAAQSVADLADVVEVGTTALAAMGPAAVAVGLALGGLAIVALDYVTEGKKVEDHLAALKKDAEDAEPAIAALRDTQLSLAVASKQLTQEQADAIRGATSAQKDYTTSIQDNVDANGKLYEEQARLTDQIGKLQAKQEESFDVDSRRGAGRAAEAAQLANLRERLSEVNAEIERNNSEVGKAAGVFVDRVTTGDLLANTLQKEREKEEALRKAKEAATEAEKKAAAAEKERLRLLALELEDRDRQYEATVTYIGAVDEMREMATKAARSQMTEAERVAAAGEDAQAKLLDVYNTAAVAANGNLELQKSAWREYQAAVVELNAETDAKVAEALKKASDERTRLRDDEAQKEKDRLQDIADANLAHVNEVGGYIQQGLGLVTDALDEGYEHSADLAAQLENQLAASEEFLTGAQQKALRKRIEAAKDAAEKQFANAKAAKVAESMASTALAAINAIAQSPPPSPFGLIGAGIATAAGVAATAAISSQEPSFTDTPGVMEMSKGGSVHLADGDLFAAAKTPQDLAAQTGGMAGNTVVVETHWKHQMIDRTVSETYRRGGRLQRDVATSTRSTPTGHRRR